MFKVICIGDMSNVCRNSGRVCPIPKVGDIDEVIEVKDYKGEEFYILKRFDHDTGYEPRYFIPLSNKDERTIKKERELDKIIDVFSHEHSI